MGADRVQNGAKYWYFSKVPINKINQLQALSYSLHRHQF
jgi:hypothetical protein